MSEQKGWFLGKPKNEPYFMPVCNRCGRRGWGEEMLGKQCGRVEFGDPGHCTGQFVLRDVNAPRILRF